MMEIEGNLVELLGGVINMNRKLNKVAKDIVDYQKDHDVPDTMLAFQLHFSVEELHDIKSMHRAPSSDEVNIIKQKLI
jgi:uncharacterized membrane protein YqgA involved in biofilm formation